MTLEAFDLRCNARDVKGRKCDGPAGSLPIPPGAFVTFVRSAKRLPDPEERNGNTWTCCRNCGRWNSYRVDVVPPLAETG